MYFLGVQIIVVTRETTRRRQAIAQMVPTNEEH